VAVDYLATGLFATFRVDAVRSSSGMDGGLFYGYSEVEFGLRLRRMGYSLYVSKDLRSLLGLSVPKNTRGPRISLTVTRDWRDYYYKRNLIQILLRERAYFTAARVTLFRYILPSVLEAVCVAALRICWTMEAVLDGWLGRLGRRYEPGPSDSDYSVGYRGTADMDRRR
jgi:GT2 family glycosyltransferase